MAKNTTGEPLPYPAAEVAASREAPMAPGVMMVRKDKHVLGLHVHPGGVAFLRNPSWPWEPQPAVTKVSRGRFIRSWVRIRFADGTKAKVRPYKPKMKGLLDAGRSDSLSSGWYTGGNNSNSNNGAANDVDSFIAILLILAMVVLFIPWMVMLAREMLGTSARAKQAAILVAELKAVTNAATPRSVD